MGFSFNELEGVDPSTGERVYIGTGDYNVMISSSEIQTSKNNRGTNLHLKYTVLDGPFQGTEVQEWLAIVNSSEKAQEIARAKLKALQIVAAVRDNGTTDDLVGKAIRLRIFKEASFFNDSNTGEKKASYQAVIKNYMSMSGKDAKGNEPREMSEEYIASIDKKAEDAVSAVYKNNGSHGGDSSDAFSNRNESQKSKQDYDDEIPF